MNEERGSLPAVIPGDMTITEHRQLSRDELELLKTTMNAKGATDDEFKLAVYLCNSLQMNPFRGQIHFIKRWDSDEKKKVMKPQIGIDGLRLEAERSGQYGGQDDALWCGPDGIWHDVWLKEEPPAAAKVTVHRIREDGTKVSFSGVALYSAYVQRRTDDGKPNRMWTSNPSGQLAKCAEALGIRKGFPAECSGLHTDVEMGQMDNVTPDGAAPKVQMPSRTIEAAAANVESAVDPEGSGPTSAPQEPAQAADPPSETEEPPHTAEAEPQPIAPLEGEKEWNGKIETCKLHKTGSNANGAWSLFFILCEDGTKFRTFSKTCAHQAKALEGVWARVIYREEEYEGQPQLMAERCFDAASLFDE